MGQSLSHLLVHSVFSTKDRCPFLRPEDIRSEIYAYMAGMLKNPAQTGLTETGPIPELPAPPEDPRGAGDPWRPT